MIGPHRQGRNPTTPSWDDLRFPATGQTVDVSGGRIDYDYDECGVAFQDNARYPQEPIVMAAQMPHSWIQGTAIRPHIHWLQSAADVPNWLVQYRTVVNGEAPSAWTLAAAETLVFTYTSGTILQISSFPEIDMTGLNISDFVDIRLFRDTGNDSALFSGADPLTGNALVKELDIHYRIDGFGSTQEFTK